MRWFSLCSLLATVSACSGGSSDPGAGDDTGTSSVVDSATASSTTDSTAPTVDSVSGSLPTADTGLVCEVEARDGVVRDCLAAEVFCDVSPENRSQFEECAACLGGDIPYYVAWLDAYGSTTSYDVVWDVCEDVPLPDRPETCSPHMVGEGVELELETHLFYGSVWSDGDTFCQWGAWKPTFDLPVRLSTVEEVAAYLGCSDGDGNEVEVPPEALEGFDLDRYDLYLRDSWGSSAIALHGEVLVVDHRCGGTSPLPPWLELRVWRIDKAAPAFEEVSCQLHDCPADRRGAPIPS